MICSLCWLATGCNTTKYLKDTECLVKKNLIEIEGGFIEKDKKNLAAEIMPLIIQQPNNESALFIPRDYLYMRFNSKNKKILRDLLGSIPTIYKPELKEQSVFNIQNYLISSKGFYNAKVTSDISEVSQKQCEVKYTLVPGSQYKINSVKYISSDTTLLKYLFKDTLQRFVREGDIISGNNLLLEKERINTVFQNLGYSDFAPQYVDIKGDSSKLEHAIDLFIEILPPAGRKVHRAYTTGDINIYTDFYNKQDTFSLESEYYENIRYLKESAKWVVKPKQIDKIILIEKDTPSNKNARVATYNKLTGLSAYRFVTINQRVDPNDSTKINYDIQLDPHSKLWTADYGLDLFYSTSQQFKNLLGTTLNGRFHNKNMFAGSEQYTFNANVNTELNFLSQRLNDSRAPVIFRTFGFGVGNEIVFPRIVNYLGFPSLLGELGILSKNNSGKYTSDAISNMNLGLNVQYILDFYSVSSYNAGFGYRIQNGSKSSLNINTLGLSYNNYSRGINFDSIRGGALLKLSFVDNFFTGFIFNRFQYIKNNTSKNGKLTTNRLLSVEVSGLEIFAANQLYNTLTNRPGESYWKLLGDEIEFSKFMRAEAEFRRNFKMNSKSSFALRGLAGMIVPLGDTKYSPFIRQFSVGGPNSLRGWLPRQLVGSFVEESKSNVLYANQGDIRIEANAEYRFTIQGLFKGGLFVDAGNTWLFNEDVVPGAGFKRDFYNQIAVSAGYGIRLDFDFFLLRFDFGYKLRSPAKLENGNHWYPARKILDQKLGNFLVGINYPF